MKSPVLAVLAAGMGSRYGGLKQMDKIGKNNEVLLDYSVYDALQAGFDKVVFIIRKDIEKDFRDLVIACCFANPCPQCKDNGYRTYKMFMPETKRHKQKRP